MMKRISVCFANDTNQVELLYVAIRSLVSAFERGERQEWTRVNLVRYRSRRDFLDFILKTSWAEDSDHKWAALARSHSLAATPRASFATMRLLPFLILVVIGLLMDRFANRSRSGQGGANA